MLALLVASFFAASGWAAEPATNRWIDVRVAGPFVCRSEFPLHGYEKLVTQLARLQTDLARLAGVPAPKERIELLLFRDEQSYRRYLQIHEPHLPYRRALFVKDQGPGRVLVHRSPDFEVDVRHECTHALLHATLPMVPLWLDEGLAEYFELPPEKRAYDNPHLKSLRWNARFNLLPKLEKLEQEDDFTKLIEKDYRDSWAWVHFMIHGPVEARRELAGFLADVHASTPPGRLSQRLAARVPNLRSQFAQHLKTWKEPPQIRQAHKPKGIWPFGNR
ncbi:MAG: hypothetical protein JW818_12055 [Pirellulales bacterium]|nr:hypothetical protein [Pirellulales bacterium]